VGSCQLLVCRLHWARLAKHNRIAKHPMLSLQHFRSNPRFRCSLLHYARIGAHNALLLHGATSNEFSSCDFVQQISQGEYEVRANRCGDKSLPRQNLAASSGDAKSERCLGALHGGERHADGGLTGSAGCGVERPLRALRRNLATRSPSP
jgi:hypothetical protein